MSCRVTWPVRGLFLICQIISVASARAVDHDIVFPPELTQFESIAAHPVFEAQGEGYWDVKIRERGWIIRDKDRWRMWYTGYDGTRAGIKRLGYATSMDGLKWTPDPSNPILKDHWIEDVCVISHDGILHMFAEGANDQAQRLTSRDGIVWQQNGRLDIRQKNGDALSDGPYGTPTAWLENGIWNLFYERSDRGIWLARSTDLKVFTNVQDDPVMLPGVTLSKVPTDAAAEPNDIEHPQLKPDERDLIALNQIITYHGRYYAVIHSSRRSEDPKIPGLWATGLAVSPDLIHWTKSPDGPLRPLSENKSSGLLIPDGPEFLLYTMHGKVDLHRSHIK